MCPIFGALFGTEALPRPATRKTDELASSGRQRQAGRGGIAENRLTFARPFC